MATLIPPQCSGVGHRREGWRLWQADEPLPAGTLAQCCQASIFPREYFQIWKYRFICEISPVLNVGPLLSHSVKVKYNLRVGYRFKYPGQLCRAQLWNQPSRLLTPSLLQCVQGVWSLLFLICHMEFCLLLRVPVRINKRIIDKASEPCAWCLVNTQ